MLITKIIVIGNQGSGKTSLIKRYVCGDDDDGEIFFTHAYTPTIGLNLETKNYTWSNGKQVRVQLWDTAGQEQFFSLSKSYFQKSHGVAVIFDLTNRESYLKIDDFWMEQIKQNAPQNVRCVLIGNKEDLDSERKVTKGEGEALAARYECSYFETSAKDGINVKESFDSLIELCAKDLDNQINEFALKLKQPSLSMPNQQSTRHFSCFDSFKAFFSSVTSNTNSNNTTHTTTNVNGVPQPPHHSASVGGKYTGGKPG